MHMPKLIECMPMIHFDGYILRELFISDSIALFPTFNDSENHKFTTFEPHQNEEQTAKWITKYQKTPIWAIATSDNTAIGFVDYHSIKTDSNNCMISYHLNKRFWGRGIVPAAVLLTDTYILNNTVITKIAATVKKENIQSQRCLLKSGYVLEKVIDNYVSSSINDHSRIRYYYVKWNNMGCVKTLMKKHQQ